MEEVSCRATYWVLGLGHVYQKEEIKKNLYWLIFFSTEKNALCLYCCSSQKHNYYICSHIQLVTILKSNLRT